MNAPLTTNAPAARCAAWAFNESQLATALSRFGSTDLTESVLEFLHSDLAAKLRISDGRRTGGLIAPRHRRAVHDGRLMLGGKVFQCALPLTSGVTVLAEFNAEYADRITVYTLSGLLICTATLVTSNAGGEA